MRVSWDGSLHLSLCVLSLLPSSPRPDPQRSPPCRTGQVWASVLSRSSLTALSMLVHMPLWPKSVSPRIAVFFQVIRLKLPLLRWKALQLWKCHFWLFSIYSQYRQLSSHQIHWRRCLLFTSARESGAIIKSGLRIHIETAEGITDLGN